MINLPEIFAAYLLADFFSGLFHWWEDRYGNPDWPVLGALIVQPNIEHHQHPGRMCHSSYANRNATTLLPCALACLLCSVPGWTFGVWVFAFLSQANEIHNWSHQKCSRPIRLLQEFGILQLPRIHAQHHRLPYDINFCVMTNWTNSLLEKLKFWRLLELLLRLVGIIPLAERKAA